MHTLNVVCRLRTGDAVGLSCIKAMMADAAGLEIFLCCVKPVEFSSAASLCCCSESSEGFIISFFLVNLSMFRTRSWVLTRPLMSWGRVVLYQCLGQGISIKKQNVAFERKEM